MDALPSRGRKGIFRPTHPEKYQGEHPIVYRSEMERVLMSKLDASPDVIAWASEALIIPWADPVTGRQRRYIPDFLVKRRSTATGLIETILIEVKPRSQSPDHVRPERKRKKTKQFITEVMTLEHNKAKWEAARRFCDAHGMKFLVLTERELGPR